MRDDLILSLGNADTATDTKDGGILLSVKMQSHGIDFRDLDVIHVQGTYMNMKTMVDNRSMRKHLEYPIIPPT